MLPQTKLIPDTDAIRRDLEFMTSRWGELGDDALFEIRAFGENRTPNWELFSLDRMSEAVDYAERMNKLGLNVYAVRNPIKATTTKSASDADIIAAFFLWADCDEGTSAQNVKRFDGPAYTAAMITGLTPSPRVHFYWELEDPCRNLQSWRDTQVAIAAHFNSDKSVINPSRIMRVAGTVTYPDTKKRGKGYISELATLNTEYEDERSPVTVDRMQRVFAGQRKLSGISSTGLTIDTGQFEGVDRERATIMAQSGQEWHNSVIRLVASYVGKGLSDAEIHALTDPLTLAGYTIDQTRAEVQKAIDGARAKGWTPEAPQVNFDHAPTQDESKPASWSLQRADAFVADFVAPEYIIEGVVQRGRLYTLTAPTGAGKTAVMLYASAAISTGMQFCEQDVEYGDVVFLAGENPDDVRARVIATLDYYNIPESSCRLHFIAGTFSIRQDLERIKAETKDLPNLVMVVVDTFAAYFDGDDENSNAQALDFARVARQLTALPSRPAVVMPAHPVKNATKGNLTPKGGSSLLNEVDGNLTLWNASGAVSMHWQGKHRGPEFEPLPLELERYETDKIKDRKGRKMPTILAKPLLVTRAMQIAQEALSNEDRLLLSIHANPAQSTRDRCVECGMVSENGKAKTGLYSKVIDRLCSDKLIKKFRRNWELTEAGERAVKMIENGEEMAYDTE